MRLQRLLLAAVLAPLLASCTLLAPDDRPARQAGRSGGEDKTEVRDQPPPPEGAIPRTFFGMHDHDPVGASWPQAPIGSFRAWDCGVMWREIETAPGVYDFSRLDAIVDTAEQHDADVLLVLGQTPPFHADNPDAESFYGPGASSAPTLKSWRAYVRALGERYAGRPVNYQVWNEANVKGFWRGTPKEMAKLTAAADEVLAEVAPDALLVAPAFVLRLVGQRAWFRSFYAEKAARKPVADYVDAVSLQLYPDAEGTPETAMELLAVARVVLEEHKVDKPIWNTEVNFGLTGLAVEPAPVVEQQVKVVRTLLLNATHGIERVYWYGWDQQQIVDTLLTAPDGVTVAPAGEAYQTAIRWLKDVRVESCEVGNEGVDVCILQAADGPRRVYWSRDGSSEVRTGFDAGSAETLGQVARDLPLGGSTLHVGRLPVLIRTAGGEPAGTPMPPRV